MVDTERAMRAAKLQCVLSPDMAYREVADRLSGEVQEFVVISRERA